METETLAKLLGEIDNLPTIIFDAVTRSVMHHELDYTSPLRARGYSFYGHLFVTYVDSQLAAGAVFWLRPEDHDWDVHVYTKEPYRRMHLAEALVAQGIVPWMKMNGCRGHVIRTTSLGKESIGLLGKLGFEEFDGEYRFTVS